MKRNLGLMVLLIAFVSAAPAYGFLDYLFGGDSSSGAVENSVLGDFRAWWTGNPAYTFNPWYAPTNKSGRGFRPGGQGAASTRGGYSINPAAPGGYAPGPRPPAQTYYPPRAAASQPSYGAPGGGYYPPGGMRGQYGPPSPSNYQPQPMMQPQAAQPSYPAPRPQAAPRGYAGGGYPAQPAPRGYGAPPGSYSPGQASVPSYFPGAS